MKINSVRLKTKHIQYLLQNKLTELKGNVLQIQQTVSKNIKLNKKTNEIFS